jgi:hypothetical protein
MTKKRLMQLSVLLLAWAGLGASMLPAQTTAVQAAISSKPSPKKCEDPYDQMNRFAKTYSDLEGWKQRAQSIREGMLRGAELLPPPAKCDLKPIMHSRREHAGYTVESVAFESLPGYFVTGNLYRPLPQLEHHAGILFFNGHFAGSTNMSDAIGGGHTGQGRFYDEAQICCATLARMGAIVLNIDMVGWGECHQYPHYDYAGGRKTLALQLWNSIRAVDFLCSLKEVDPKRLGATGASGGGVQTIFLVAVDDRVAVSVPVVGVHCTPGGCNCECSMPIYKSDQHETNPPEVAALAAPRPMLIISDFPDLMPAVEFPYILNVYRLYDPEKKMVYGIERYVQHVETGGHNYSYIKRSQAYQFLSQWLQLSLKNVLNAQKEVDESFVVIEPEANLQVFNKDHPRPEHALKDLGQYKCSKEVEKFLHSGK